MAIYDLFYDLMTNILGETALLTEQGQLLRHYASLIFCIVAVVTVFKLIVWLANAVTRR